MIEVLSKAVENIANKNIENLGKNFDFKLPGIFKKGEMLSDSALEARAEAAAFSACKFFNLPEARIIKGDSIGVAKRDTGTLNDDVFKYSIDQFKKMNCTSFDDMAKVWSHECGHRLLQDVFPDSWADELGADFFTGVRSEMMGLPKNNFEKLLGSTSASESHPGGQLRLKAMDYGRQVAHKMKLDGCQPTLENCIEAFKQSPFSKITYENNNNGQFANFINNREYHYKQASEAQHKVEYNLKQAKEAAEKGDLKGAADYANSAKRWESTVKDEKRAAERSTQFVDSDNFSSFIDDKAYHYKQASEAQHKVEYNLKQAKEAAEKGDLKGAADYANSAKRWESTVKDEKRAADRSTK